MEHYGRVDESTVSDADVAEEANVEVLNHLYPLLDDMEVNWPSILVELGIVLELAQQFSLVFNKSFTYGAILRGISIPLYFLILPFWDTKYDVHYTYTLDKILFWILFAGVTILVILLVACGLTRRNSGKFFTTTRLATYTMIGPLFLPQLHEFLSLMVCDQGYLDGTRRLTSYPEQQCFQGDVFWTIMFAAGVLGSLFIFIPKFVITMAVFDDHPLSDSLRARTHNVVEFWMLSYEIIAAVLYHLLTGIGQRETFAGLFAAGSFFMALLHIFYLPFMQQRINRIRVVGLACLFYCNLVNVLVLHAANSSPLYDGSNNWDAVVIIPGVLLVGVLSYRLADWRISLDFRRDIQRAQHGEVRAGKYRRRMLFPHYLPLDERTEFTEENVLVHGTNCTAANSGTLDHAGQNSRSNFSEAFMKRDQIDELTDFTLACYVEKIYVPSDVELSNRFVRAFAVTTSNVPSEQVLGFASRIYAKGLNRFVRDKWLMLQFATFLCSFTSRLNPTAQRLCEDLSLCELSPVLAYRLHRRVLSINLAVRRRQRAYRKALSKALALHKETLINVNNFWKQLKVDQVGVSHLGLTAGIIVDGCYSGMKFYSKAITESVDTYSLIRYAQFLDDVVLDAESAENTRELAIDLIEKRESGLLSDNSIPALQMDHSYQIEAKYSRFSRSLRVFVGCLCAVLFLLMAGFLGVLIANEVNNEKVLNRVESASLCRFYTMRTLFSANVAMQSSTVAPIWQTLESDLTQLRIANAAITYGSEKSMYSKVVDIMKQPYYSYFYPQLGQFEGMGLWRAGEQYISALESMVLTQSTAADRAAAYSLITSNELNGAAAAYNDSLTVFLAEASSSVRAYSVAISILYVASLAFATVVFFILRFYLARISGSRLSTLGLFRLIPRVALADIVRKMSDRIENFEAPDPVFEGMLMERGMKQEPVGNHTEITATTSKMETTEQKTVNFAPPQNNVVSGDASAADRTAAADEDSAIEGSTFAHLSRNSTVADVGRLKIHQGQHETPYQKNEFIPTEETNEEIRERKKIQEEEEAYFSTGTTTQGEDEDVEGTEDYRGLNRLVKTSSSGRSFYTPRHALLPVLAFAIALVVGGLGVQRLSATASQSSSKVSFVHTMQECIFSINDMLNAAESMAVDPSSTGAVVLFSALESVRQSSVSLSGRVESEQSVSLSTAYALFHNSFRIVYRQALAAATLGCFNSSDASLDCSFLDNTVWTADLFLPTTEPVLMDINMLLPTTRAVDTKLSQETMGQLAQNTICSPYYIYLKQFVTKSFLEAKQTLQQVTLDDISSQVTLDNKLKYVLLVMGSVLCVVLLIQLVEAGCASQHLLFVIVLSMFLLSIGSLVLTGILFAKPLPRDGPFANVVARYNAVEHLISVSDQAHEDAKQAAIGSLELGALHFETDGFSALDSAWTAVFSVMESNSLTQLTTAFSNMQYCMLLDGITVVLACQYNNFNPSFCDQPNLASLNWNLMHQSYGYRLWLKYRNNPNQMLYINRTYDMNDRSPGEQYNLSRSLLFGPLRLNHSTASSSALLNTLATYSSSQSDLVSSRYDEQYPMALCIVIFGFAIAIVSLAVAIITVISYVEEHHIRAGLRATAGSSINQKSFHDASMQRLVKSSGIVLLLFAIMLSGMFVVVIVQYAGSVHRDDFMNPVTLRSAEAVEAAVNIQFSIKSPWYIETANYFADQSVLTAEMYYRMTDMSFAKKVSELLFGSSDITFNRYSEKIVNNRSIAGFQTQSTVIAFNGLVDPSQRRWRQETLEMSQMTTAVRATMAANIYNQVFSLSDYIRDSSSEIKNQADRERTTWFIVHLTLFGVTFLVLIFMTYYLLVPVVKRLIKEEEGTHVMLRMIPLHIRESVPAIAEYMTTGRIVQDANIGEIDLATREFNIVPTIAIDAHGIITHFCRAAEELFLWTQAEAIGQNVGILMPDNIAAEHDHYIKNYLRTGEKKAIGQTRFVRAKRKDGSIFPATLNLIENRVGKNLTFVGVLRNCQEDLEFERATSLSLALTDASTIPLIVIDVHGVIMKFSKAAEVTFKCSAEEVIGRKVNVLMPRAEAEVHDRHLEKYLRTGMKTIVDTFRFVKGKRLNGEVFPAQLSVREMQHRGVTYFIGYVEDLTDRLHLEMIYASSNLTKALSPTPLIIADVEGRIQHVSESATRVFGFSETQMINQFMTLILDANTAAQVSLRYYKIRPKTPVVVTGTAKRREEADESVTSFQARVTIKFFSIQDKGDRVLVYVEDVTKRDTQQLESMVGAAVTSLSSIPIILTEDDGEMVQLNPAAESAFQMTAADAYGRNVDLLLGPYELTERASSVNRESGSDFGGGRDSVASSAQGHLSPFEQIMEDYKKTGSSSHVGRIMRGTGQTPHGERTFPVDVLVKDVTLEGRRMFLVYLRDISSDLRLLEANRWNDALMSLSQMPMVCANLEGTIFACSDTACTQFNWSREELIGENVSVLMPLRYARDHNRILENFRRSLDATAGGDLTNRAKRSILHREIVLTGRTRNGDEFPVALCVKDARIEGSEVFLVASLRDCTSEMQLTVQKNIGKAIAALSPALFVCITTTGTITEFSHSAEDHFGYTANEVIGKNIKMLMPDDVAVNHDGYLRSYEKTRVKHILDCAVTVTARHKDGSAFSVELYVTEIRNKDKSEFVGYLKNISESIALKQTVEINDVLLGLATSPMIELDRQGIITKCNGHAVREFGLTSDKDALGKKVDVLFPQVVLPDGTRSYKNWLADALDQLSDLCARNDAIHAYDNQHKTAKTSQRRSVSHSLQNSQRQFASVDRELVGRRRGGQDFQVKVTLSEISVENDADPQRVSEDARVVLCLQNIAVDMGLKMQNEMNATMTSLSRTPFVYTDADGIITSFSRAAEEVFGYVSGEAIGKPISMVLPRDMGERFMKNFVSYQVTGVKAMPDGVPHRITCCRKGGAFFPVELTVIEDVVPDGKIYFIHYFRDISTEAASASEAGLRDALTKESPVAVIVTDHEGRVEEYSQAAEALLLIPAVEFVGRNIRALEALPMALGAQEGGDGEEGDFDDDGIEGTKREFANFFYANMHQHEGQGKSIQERVRIRRGDNSTFRAEVHICSVLPYRSKLPRFIAYIVSLEDKLTIQDDLAQANGLFDATVSAVFVVSLRAAVVDYNAAAQTLLKLGAPGTSTSCPLSSLVPPGSSLLRAVHGILEKLRVEVSSDTDDEQSMVPSSTTTVNVDWSTNKNFVSQLHDVVFLAKDGSELMVNATLTIAPPCDARDKPTIIINACNTTEDRLSADCVSKEVSTLRVAGVATMEIGADGGFLFCSEGCLSVLGFRMDQLMGKQCQELMPSGYDRITPFVRNALRAIESGAPLPVVENMVFLFKRKDNAVVKMPGELRCIVKPDGSLFSVVAQLTLPLQSEQRLSELAMTAMTLSSDAVVLASLNGTIQCTNLAATQMFGVPDDVSLVGTKVTSLLADEEGKSFIRQYHRHTVSTYPTTLLAQAYSSASEDDDENVAQPHRFLVEVLLREVADAVTQAESVGGLDGSALLLVHFRNVEQEQSLLQQKKIIQTALEFSFHAVIVINAGGIISLFSEVAEDFSGVPADMAVGRDVTSLLLFEEDGHWLKSSITDLRRKGQTELLQAPRRVRVKHYEPDENGLGPVARTTTMEMTVFELHLTTADSSFEFVMYLSRLDE